eukprot:TRINITY_DN67570_c8_g4_i2.p1 TRINITY_DN67570_c8_g4~~TRINITY_DN67570_c8_g4_i2.p1  ORF type:complete len:285 (-),score=55.93 TRINITY_DN67570_c8_g4_i2:1393-2247(-)
MQATTEAVKAASSPDATAKEAKSASSPDKSSPDKKKKRGAAAITPPELKGSNRDSPSVLTTDQLRHIVYHLPPRFRTASQWTLKYNSLEHGISLDTMYRNLSKSEHHVFIIRTMKGQVLGAFVPGKVAVSTHYTGTGETFVFTFGDDPTNEKIVVYKWKGDFFANEHFILASHEDGLHVGGGGHPALWLHKMLLKGSSGQCQTFASPPLISGVPTKVDDSQDNHEFDIYAVEWWQVPSVETDVGAGIGMLNLNIEDEEEEGRKRANSSTSSTSTVLTDDDYVLV